MLIQYTYTQMDQRHYGKQVCCWDGSSNHKTKASVKTDDDRNNGSAADPLQADAWRNADTGASAQ